eukprot:TRINITY_DN5991_c1_g2_i2.p1 TRINITY_DN5991_c1_g2~~TRINITY_DN5991_c1_g2_i2.p1  ORF type:complete len:635 (+),score=136.86 TRINITY_DN5991_c1_g2_i2:41-1906(+)
MLRRDTLFMLHVLLPFTATVFVGSVQKCEVNFIATLLEACNVGCCFSPDCSCYNQTHYNIDSLKNHLDTGRWCVWSYCVITALSDCPAEMIRIYNETYFTAIEWEDACRRNLDLYGCGIADYGSMLNCLTHQACWQELDITRMCGAECINETTHCQKVTGCDKDIVQTCKQGYMGLADFCRNHCGDCLEQSCEAILIPEGKSETFKLYILPVIISLSVGGCCLAVLFYRKWKNLQQRVLAAESAPTPEHAPTNEKLPPSQFVAIKGQWQRGNLVGRGQYGAVYLAILPSGHVLAVKQIDAVSVATDPTARSSYLHEIEALQSLYHPNIVMYYGASFDPEARLINLFMEYVAGGSLAKFVKNLPQILPEEAAKVYIKQVVLGLEYLHSRNIVHRDIKGDNILISHQEGIVKITDFGSSRKVQQTLASMSGATLTGTPNWMAPELITSQIYEEIPFKKKLDVWSVGCTVVEILNKGKPPWPSFTSQWAALFHIANSNAIPDGIPDHISELCKSFISGCLKRNVEERDSINDLLQHPWLSDSAPNFKFECSIHDPELADLTEDWKKLSSQERSEQQASGETNREVITACLRSACEAAHEEHLSATIISSNHTDTHPDTLPPVAH